MQASYLQVQLGKFAPSRCVLEKDSGTQPEDSDQTAMAWSETCL